ncbi:MAG: hypothetical protein JNJ89_02095 [Rubrivivax sp.]|nr:hypothetical protein [Rubrivivax sp.]
MTVSSIASSAARACCCARRAWRALIGAFAACAALSACGQRVVYEGPGLPVPADFGCWHDVGYVVNWPKLGGQDLYYGPDPAFTVRANRVRLYGMGGLEWNNTEKTPGVFDWARWDEAFAKLRRTGVKRTTLNLYNPPQWANRHHPHNYGGWRMQLPREREMLERWLSAVTSRYAEIDAIEVANEVFTPKIGTADSYFTGTAEDLALLSDWTLDWRRKSGWRGRIWAPSIPGFGENIPTMLEWLRKYPRASEFDAFPVHLYHLLPEQVGQRANKATFYSGLVEFREGLAALGLGPMIDSEKGFDPGTVREGTIYNYAVAALVHGVQQTCFFMLGSYGNDETNLGQPFRTAWAKDDLEAVADLAGHVIVKVVTTERGRWQVSTRPVSATPAAAASVPSAPSREGRR